MSSPLPHPSASAGASGHASSHGKMSASDQRVLKRAKLAAALPPLPPPHCCRAAAAAAIAFVFIVIVVAVIVAIAVAVAVAAFN